MTKIGRLWALFILASAAFAQNAAVSLRTLIAEARQNNAAIRAADRAIDASRYGPVQASALPDTEVMVQQFSVGSPRPYAGYSNSDFAYIGFGASQELPYPGKRGLRAQVAQHEVAISGAEKNAVIWEVLTRLKLAYYQLAASQLIHFDSRKESADCRTDQSSGRDAIPRRRRNAGRCAAGAVARYQAPEWPLDTAPRECAGAGCS